ncbi:hypothetical protein [Halomonas halophila]|uniref:hypothetical protein n=1 Tax=Halomonas halophila TaxID=29573 RepID=UPI0036265C90
MCGARGPASAMDGMGREGRDAGMPEGSRSLGEGGTSLPPEGSAPGAAMADRLAA